MPATSCENLVAVYFESRGECAYRAQKQLRRLVKVLHALKTSFLNGSSIIVLNHAAMVFVATASLESRSTDDDVPETDVVSLARCAAADADHGTEPHVRKAQGHVLGHGYCDGRAVPSGSDSMTTLWRPIRPSV